MIPRADITNAIQPIAAVDAPTAITAVADAKQEAFSRLAQIAIGQQLQAKVLSTYNDGSYLVRIANTAARMVLPSATRTGDSLLLTMVGKQPRPTFFLHNSSGAIEESTAVSLSTSSSMMKQDLPSLRSATQPAAQTLVEPEQGLAEIIDNTSLLATAQTSVPSSNTTLSIAGKLVDALLQVAPESPLPYAIKTDAALVNTPTNTTQLAAALHDSIVFSGSFYESHVALWSAGKRSLAQLQKEPQAQLSQHTQANTITALLSNADPVGTQLGQLIHLQLNTLEQQRIVWHAEVWPGQQMEWEIGQDTTDTPSPDAPDHIAVPMWHSVLRLNFDNLGSVSASIRLIGQQIQMQLHADNASTATALRDHAHLLSQAMAAAGSTLDGLIVKRHGET